MHARYPSYSPPLDSPPLTPPHKNRHDHRRRPIPILRRRRLLLLFPLLLLSLYLSGFHLPRRKPIHEPSLNHKNIIWSRYAYSMYATNQAYLCNAVMVFESLHRYGSKADRILFHPDDWDTDIANGEDRNSQLLVKARDLYGVDLIPVDMKEFAHMIGDDVREEEEQRKEAEEKEAERKKREASGDKSKTPLAKKKKKNKASGTLIKFLAWSRTEYHRIMHLDGDITLNRHLDELFLLPAAPVAMTRSYWLLPNSTTTSHAIETLPCSSSVPLSSILILLTPSDSTFKTLTSTANQLLSSSSSHSKKDPSHPDASLDTDTTILNNLFSSSALILPHFNLLLQSSEFRRSDHSSYLSLPQSPRSLSSTPSPPSTSDQQWQPTLSLSTTALLHFSDPPLPKPWIMHPHLLLPHIQPSCRYATNGQLDNCEDRKVWRDIYDGFRRRRKDVCALLSAPAPDWWEGMDGIGGVKEGKGEKEDGEKKKEEVGDEKDKGTEEEGEENK